MVLLPTDPAMSQAHLWLPVYQEVGGSPREHPCTEGERPGTEGCFVGFFGQEHLLGGFNSLENTIIVGSRFQAFRINISKNHQASFFHPPTQLNRHLDRNHLSVWPAPPKKTTMSCLRGLGQECIGLRRRKNHGLAVSCP